MGRIFLASLYTNKTQHWKRGLISEVYRDGTFELVPIANDWGEPHQHDRTYDGVPSWHQPTKSLAKLLGFDTDRARTIVHDDPDLHTHFAYGDAYGSKSAKLFNAQCGDWLLVIANLAYAQDVGKPELQHAKTGWYFVGCLKIRKVDFAGNGNFHHNSLSHHQHWRDAKKWRYDKVKGQTSVIVAGIRGERAQRLTKAVPILTERDVSELLRDKHCEKISVRAQSKNGKRKFPTVMACVGSYTRAIRPIGDTGTAGDRSYLTRLRRVILKLNPKSKRVLWPA